jgi:ribosomal protein S18 acetylase RimI-like enzyme
MSTLIRAAELNDAPALAEVHVRTWQHAYRGKLPDNLLDRLSVERRTEQWREWLKQPQPGTSVSVAIEGDKIVGFCWVGPTRDSDAGDGTGELLAFYVLPNFQGSGVGNSLMLEGLRQLKQAGFQRVTLWVLDTNTKARGFYERCGWTADGSRKTEDWGSIVITEVRYQIDLANSE